MTVWIVSIEPHEQRYTGEWATHLPDQLADAAKVRGVAHAIRTIDGGDVSGGTTPGAFLNFGKTNIWKGNQIAAIGALFANGDVAAGDKFLFTDAWHPGAVCVRYMSDLLRVPVQISGLFHAGSYDPHDFLGRIPDRRWSLAFERALYETYDANCFATQFHIDMFAQAFQLGKADRIRRVGWPMEYLRKLLKPTGSNGNRKLVLFPHRLAPEKQVEIFQDLAGEFPDYEFRVCQENPICKTEYHELLQKTAVVFSTSKQETLGIGLWEGLLCGAVPMAPDRLSYSEMYPAEFLYPSEWTESWEAYQAHRDKLVGRLRQNLRDFAAGQFEEPLRRAVGEIGPEFFDGSRLYEVVFS